MCPHGMLLTHFYAQKPVLCKINLHFRALYPEPLPSCLSSFPQAWLCCHRLNLTWCCLWPAEEASPDLGGEDPPGISPVVHWRGMGPGSKCAAAVGTDLPDASSPHQAPK